MNKRDWIVLSIVEGRGYANQREIGYKCGYSLGVVNASLKKLTDEGYLDKDYRVTDKTKSYLRENSPKRAVILAAGPGLRMLPINNIPKGLLRVNDEPLIERVIRQLHEVGIRDITVVVGYMMERFEYLSDKFSVELLVNNDYISRDSLHSLRLAADVMSFANCYIVPGDIWFARNPFSPTEYHSWYGVGSFIDDDSVVRVNRKMELVETEENQSGNSMLGLCYLCPADGAIVRENVLKLDKNHRNAKTIWEQALFDEGKMLPYAKVMLGQTAFEIKTYEQLRELDNESGNLTSKRINLIKAVFGVEESEITDISALTKGMTNRLMRFSVKGKAYLMRIPGEGSDKLANRISEKAVYKALKGKGITDKVVYLDEDSGYKITEYIPDARSGDVNADGDVRVCVELLKRLHDMEAVVDCGFDIFEKIQYYESLRGPESSYGDYDSVRHKVFGLKALIEKCPARRCLCHIDPVMHNFLFTGKGVLLADWEYSGMADPHMDIAMFCIYAMYSKERFDSVIDMYFGGDPGDETRMKIYCYAAAGGLLWSLWCEYKLKFGVQFGEYALRQYQYAKRYWRCANELAEKLGKN